MIFSKSAEHAIRGLSELAGRARADSMMLDDVIAGTDIPRDFLAKLFQKLVRAGILRSTKGRGGGFALAGATHEITLMQVVLAVEDCPAGQAPAMDRCVVGLEACTDDMPCPQHDLYKPIRQRLKDYLTTTTLADMVASLRAKESWQRLRAGVQERIDERQDAKTPS
jgi:Rrf2 family protein